MNGPDEFDTIAALLRPLAEGAPEALNLEDDAAVIAGRPGFDLVVTKDALVAGVHFLADDPLDLVARKALRVNLSDLAAKGAEPYGYFLSIAWPKDADWSARESFAAGLAGDQAAFGLKLFGGDTVATPGPLTISVTMLGWVKAGEMVRRNGARPGDLLQVSGPIGDGVLSLAAAQGRLDDLPGGGLANLVRRYRLPQPRTDLTLTGVTASADISDGLVADAGHVAAASGVRLEIDLERVPLSAPGQDWLAQQPDKTEALTLLVTGGDDYELIVTAPAPLPKFTVIGRVVAGEGVAVNFNGHPLELTRAGYRHGNDD